MITPLDIARESQRLERASPEERLAFAVATWGDRLLYTSSFGAGSGVLLHMWSRVAAHLPVVVIDTGFLFDETHAYIKKLSRQLGLTIEYARPEVPRDEFLWEHGADVMGRDPDLCCARNKIAPLVPYTTRALAWVSGLRRDQGTTREHLPVLQPTEAASSSGRDLEHPTGPGPIKVHPLATMTREQVHVYMKEHGIDEHPLVARRYLSIGCWPCTQAVAEGQDERAGRWAGSQKTECGIHTFLQSAEPVRSTENGLEHPTEA